MKENYLIKIEGVQESDGETNSIELMTKGSFIQRNGTGPFRLRERQPNVKTTFQRNGNYFISYRETEATGYEGCTTTVKLDRSGMVSMLRFGPSPSQLTIEKGQRHLSHYETGHGAITMGIAADEIVADLNENGGSLHFSYNLDINSSLFSKNTVNITVREAQ